MTKSLDHVCILVKDIDQAIERYKNILSVCSPEVANQAVEKHEEFAGDDKYISARFVAGGDGCDIQLLQPLDPKSPLYKRLEKRGEHIHHLGFTSSNLERTLKDLRNKGVTLYSKELLCNINNQHPKWNWILPQYAHGVLIEVMDE